MISVGNIRYGSRGVNVMRPHVLGNPLVIGRDGTRAEVIAQYRRWLWAQYKAEGPVRAELDRLAAMADDVVLVCCCRPLECHADVIKACLDWIQSRAVGVNIFSGSDSELGAALTNPTTWSVSKGKLTRQYPVRFRDRVYADAEAAYQAHKAGAMDQARLLTEVIAEKLRQHPGLYQAITQRGGVQVGCLRLEWTVVR